MKENNLKSINDLLGEFSQQKKIKVPLREARIVNLWRPLMGEMIHRYTDKIYVKNEVLFIRVQQAALKNELMYLQEQIIEKINKEVGENAIRKIVLL
jgi:predicted nucleic acid-binding Zn ribbon protein